jgi:hypothetical protein
MKTSISSSYIHIINNSIEPEILISNLPDELCSNEYSIVLMIIADMLNVISYERWHLIFHLIRDYIHLNDIVIDLINTDINHTALYLMCCQLCIDEPTLDRFDIVRLDKKLLLNTNVKIYRSSNITSSLLSLNEFKSSSRNNGEAINLLLHCNHTVLRLVLPYISNKHRLREMYNECISGEDEITSDMLKCSELLD